MHHAANSAILPTRWISKHVAEKWKPVFRNRHAPENKQLKRIAKI
ncbi:hypothetical protein CES86_2137 [Brucella lupini]|uniref:Uncharacterized protein n=1 Tax=Brucella lupini TaxID=255457 RepID=A0A256GQX1_9HYPH|nr:hypothetical protein CES86_2137 [Brucella lupini]